MSFTSGPASFQRFFLSARRQELFTDKLLEALRQQAFGTVPVLSDLTQVGWVGPGHVFQTDFAAEHIGFGRYVLLNLRVDRLKAPASLVRAYVEMEQETALAASGREMLSKGQRRQAREAALLRAEQEAKSGAFRRITAAPVLIDLEGGTVLLGGGGAALAEKLENLLGASLKQRIERATPALIAAKRCADSRLSRAIETLDPFVLAERPDAHSLDADDDRGDGRAGEEAAFLGKELLTWLWFRSQTQREGLRVRGKDAVSISIERVLRLKCDYGVSGVDVLNSDAPHLLPEARAAVRTGKQPVKAGLIIGTSGGDFRLTLDGEKMAVSGLRVPEPAEQDEAGSNEVERRIARFDLIFEVVALIDALFEMYLMERVSPGWETVESAMRAWAAGRERKAVQAAG